MNRMHRIKIGILLFIFLLSAFMPVSAAIPDREEIEKHLGQGQLQQDVLVITFSRGDLQPRIQGEIFPEGMGPVSRTVWRRVGRETMVLGSFVLLESEVNPVISALQSINIEITTVHDHPVVKEPRLKLLYLYGVGKPDSLAPGIRDALTKTGAFKPDGSRPVVANEGFPKLDIRRIEKIVGLNGKVEGGVFRIALDRKGVSILGIRVPPAMGLYSWAGFMGTNERAQVGGEIATPASEVNSVIRALRSGGISVTALDHHFLDEEPRIFFVHYWGAGPAERLARIIHEVFEIITESTED